MNQFAKETLPISLEEEMRRSYLDYAMSVIVGRALPDVRDGLKPVHRRVLFAMHEANNVHNRPYVKCARVVGDVMGKYHPHGDQAIYDTLVRMAQDFSLRYTLVDGQGNFGSVDGDNAAAMRYTECRLDKISAELLADIDKETIDFQPNYDGKEQEPTVLPSRLPNLLINGSAGIAVGMATNMPPHNLSDVIDACLYALRAPDCTVDELIEIIKAPDFPTAGIIYGLGGVREGYRTGRGRVVMRARCHFEEIDKNGRQAIIVDEIPYQVNKKTLQERIAELVNEKKIEGISDIRDESDKSGMRVVIELKRNEVPEIVLNNLYKQTQLQDTFGMNLVALVGVIPGQNLMVSPEGRWLSGYLPFQMKSYPFALAPAPNGELVLCIVERDGTVVDGPGGNAFFDSAGELDPVVAQTMKALVNFEREKAACRGRAAELEAAGIIKPWDLAMQTYLGPRKIEGLYQVDEVALQTLDDAAFLELRKTGALSLAYCQMLSMQNVANLAHRAQIAPPAPVAVPPMELDFSRLGG